MLQKLILTIFLALCILASFTNAFNLRSDDTTTDDGVKPAEALSKDISDGPTSTDSSATGSNDNSGVSTGSETGKAQPTEEANKWLTPAEKLVKADKKVAKKLQEKYEIMSEEQNKIRAMLESRLKQSESGDKNLINKLVAEASEKAFERYKNEIAKHIDVIYERIKPKIEETCINLGFTKGSNNSPKSSATGGSATGGAVDNSALDKASTGGEEKRSGEAEKQQEEP
eukprot:g7281.t1